VTDEKKSQIIHTDNKGRHWIATHKDDLLKPEISLNDIAEFVPNLEDVTSPYHNTHARLLKRLLDLENEGKNLQISISILESRMIADQIVLDSWKKKVNNLIKEKSIRKEIEKKYQKLLLNIQKGGKIDKKSLPDVQKSPVSEDVPLKDDSQPIKKSKTPLILEEIILNEKAKSSGEVFSKIL